MHAWNYVKMKENGLCILKCRMSIYSLNYFIFFFQTLFSKLYLHKNKFMTMWISYTEIWTNVVPHKYILLYRFCNLKICFPPFTSSISRLNNFFLFNYTPKTCWKPYAKEPISMLRNHSSRAFFSQTTEIDPICGINTWQIILEPFSRVDSIKTSWMRLDTSIDQQHCSKSNTVRKFHQDVHEY